MAKPRKHPNLNSDKSLLVYDGECPFCTRYVKLLKLREALGTVELVNARERHPVLATIRDAGLDLDEGMVLKIGPEMYHGADCINRLALMTSTSGVFNRVNAWIFRRPGLARVLYPFMKRGRAATLALMNRSKISENVAAQK